MQRQGESIRVRGTVQGVGFRPRVWQLATDCGLDGRVWNDAAGVRIEAWGTPPALQCFVDRLRAEAPPLARIEALERQPLAAPPPGRGFHIVASRGGEVRTAIAADAATCPECLRELRDPADRRYRYPFINCTHCGPRLSIVRALPYDRANTSMAGFALCPACAAEYRDPADRRFHAQPNACPDCGPRLWLEDADGRRADAPLAAAVQCIRDGGILAVKGIGGIHLACDAGNEAVVRRLRERKRRPHKPLALMAPDLDAVRRYARVSAAEARLLADPAAPIVLLEAHPDTGLAVSLAPGQPTLGFMLPYTPLHHLLLESLERPIVLTSGNRSGQPQCIDNDQARDCLRGIADAWLLHDRDILNRLDDSVLRVMAGRPRLLRRARGLAPRPLDLPAGFAGVPPLLAMGGELKNCFCLIREGQAILSQHMGDLEDAATLADYRQGLDLYRRLFEHRPQAIVVDGHPDYLSRRLGQELARTQGLPLETVPHHHAHLAASLAAEAVAPGSGPVLGVILDGLGMGEDGTLWGGEFLCGDYLQVRRLARFAPVPLPGGNRAMREPWRNTYAHLCQALGRERLWRDHAGLELLDFLAQQPLAILDRMVERGLNSPPASSCGRLFDAVAAALGICREAVSYEGQAAVELEALAVPEFESEAGAGYGCECRHVNGLETLHWGPLWKALLGDLAAGVPAGRIAARFHQGLAACVAETAIDLCRREGLGQVALGGGVFQNRLLLEAVARRLEDAGLEVLIPSAVPLNDGGLALGQAAVAAARWLARHSVEASPDIAPRRRA
ncbi:carbamoyltransferase HypF [Thiohalobacter sp. IOR34]|uniref:carbamoyltransferase HypF n=1 Tax=Thiohalobacter sp. IOR34 TaxID=3057176 RepID=UPI0025B15658|nr:carbamoyltransferase HypF [Thiohalobacter sp. IOR34]WJW76394.1 carbamoyltransferase HypF [Thiohalobacter sp. IOR34]